ncbi:MAG: hypothetical protein U1E62_24575 [Alsobacter sp.]
MTVSGPSDLLSTVLSMQSDATQQSMGVAAARQAIKAEREVASLVAEVAAAAAPGTGALVDRRA